MTHAQNLRFELALQTANGVVLSQHSVAAPCTVLQAVLGTNAPLKAHNMTVGVWSRSIKAGQWLQDGDRVECYLPLLADPKDARRARVNRSLTAQATKENAANRANNRAHRARREAEKRLKTTQNT